MITVVNKRKGGTGIYIGRPSIFGNPFRPGTRGIGETLNKYEAWLRNQIRTNSNNIVDELKLIAHENSIGNINLVCWCAPSPCHGDVIKRCIEEEWWN